MTIPTSPIPAEKPALPRSQILNVFLLSAATLVFEINLTRLFSVAQFYHFAFMIVSLALLGYGSSGTYLALRPPGPASPQAVQAHLRWLSVAAGLSILGAYLAINLVPFDSFSIAFDPKQAWILAFHYLALATPFFFSGFVVGLLLTYFPSLAPQIYAVNLIGSAAGCALALILPSVLSGEGVVVFASALAAVSQVPLPRSAGRKALIPDLLPSILALAFSGLALFDGGLRLSGRPSFSWLELRISPYKSLSYALQYPTAQVIFRRWNAFSRIDVVRSPGVRSFPGLSYRYLQPPPVEDGLLVDGDDLSPILQPSESGEVGDQADFYAHLPAAIAFQLRPGAETIVLEPRGGLDILTAQALGASEIVAVEVNPLIVEAAAHVYQSPRVTMVLESDRSFLQRSTETFDVVVVSLAASYHPVRSGAYSLAEDYRYTVESVQAAIEHLNPDGILVITRWIQMPPSETLRAFALAVTAVDRMGGDPATQIVAMRGYNTGTLLVKRSAFEEQELAEIRRFSAERAFDLTYAPGLRPEESNLYNILPEPVYYQAFTQLLATQPREHFYDSYPSDVRPPTDDHPFFGHFFKWSQAGEVIGELGKTWQPFGGAGYFVILALLALSLVMSGLILLLPALVARLQRRVGSGLGSRPAFLVYFGLIGLAFLLVEIPLIQRFILFLGQPSYALTAVLFTLLLFSGLGSRFGMGLRFALPALVVLLIAMPLILPPVFYWTLGWSFGLRLAVTVIVLAPLGFLMGIPFPAGIGWLYRSFTEQSTARKTGSTAIPLVWAVNGAASVVSAVLSALLSLSFGFNWVFRLGSLCYAAAWFTVLWSVRPRQK